MAGIFDSLITDDPRQQAYMALAAGLLAGRGSFNKVAGEALMGSQQTYRQAQAAKAQQEQQAIHSQLWQAQADKARAEAKYRADLLAKGINPDDPADIRAANLFMMMTPDQQRQALMWKRGDYVIKDVNGVPTRVSNSGLGGVSPLTTLDEESAGQAAIAGAKQRAIETQKAAYDIMPNAIVGVGPDAQRVPATRLDFLQQMPRFSAPTPSRPAPLPAGREVVSPELQASRDSDRMKILQDELSKETNPDVRAALQREIGRVNMSAVLPSASAVRLGPTPREEAINKGSAEAQSEFMKSTRTAYDSLKFAPSVLQNIEAAKKLVPSAANFMGPGGESMLNAAKFLNNRLGTDIKLEGVKSAEEMRTRLFSQIMENLKKMDAQPSQLQQQMMMSSLGNLGTDPQALPRVLDVMAQAVRNKVDIHNKEVESAKKNGVVFPYDPIIKFDDQSGDDLGGGFRVKR